MRLACPNQLSPTQNLMGNGSQVSARNLATYATWNPSDKGSGVTLSGGDLTVSIAATNPLARSTLSKSSGKWYWEIRFTSASTFPVVIGIATSAASLATYLGAGATGWSYYGGQLSLNVPKKINNAVQTAYGTKWATNDYIGVALDIDAGTLAFYLNGVSQGTAFTGLSGTFFAAISGSTGAGGPETATANFGATAFVYAAPSGYNSGLYS